MAGRFTSLFLEVGRSEGTRPYVPHIILVGLGPATATPDASISIDADTYGRLRERTLPPAEAYFAGKVRMTGDTGLAMQLCMAMLPRFS